MRWRETAQRTPAGRVLGYSTLDHADLSALAPGSCNDMVVGAEGRAYVGNFGYDKNNGAPRARVTMKAGDVAAMPADIRHQGYSRKRSMLYVWENVTPGLPQRYESGELSPYPVEF